MFSAALVSPAPASTRFLAALLAYDHRGAEQTVRAELAAGASLSSVYVEVLQAALYELGARWERGEITVPQEHYCTAATQNIMSLLHEDMFTAPTGKRRLLAAAVGGNMHSIGIRMVADVFELRGWSTVCIGADTPAEAMMAHLAREPFDAIAISAALSAHLPEVAALVRAVRSSPSAHLPILVGGRAFNAESDVWRSLGADGHAIDPDQAVALAETLVGRSSQARRRRLSLVELQSVPVVNLATEDEPRALAAMSELNTELHDVSRLLALRNAELVRVNAQLNRVMGIVAHDLRNPLAVMTSHAVFLGEDLAAALGDDQRESLAAIAEASGFMKRLLDDMLDVSQIRAHKLALHREPLELVSFIAHVAKLNAPHAQRKAIVLRCTSTVPSIELSADGAKLQQVVNNLIGNAIQYSPPNSEIDVLLDLDETTISLVVRDRGLGIAAAELDKVFGAFETTSTRGTAGEKSTGLGLAIVKAIVEAHGGTVRVESKLGEGSSFHVTLPRGLRPDA